MFEMMTALPNRRYSGHRKATEEIIIIIIIAKS